MKERGHGSYQDMVAVFLLQDWHASQATHFQVEISTIDLQNTKQNTNHYFALEDAF
jgi:hypothetical protein